MIRCGGCGRAMALHPYPHATDRFECRGERRCFRSVKITDLINALIIILEQTELPALEAKAKNGADEMIKVKERQIEKLQKQMEDYLAQEETQFELLEKKQYTQDIFDRRNNALHKKMEECQAALYKAKASIPKQVNYAEKIIALKDAIAALRNDSLEPAEKNRILKLIVDQIIFTGETPLGSNKGIKMNNVAFTLEVFLRL